MTRLDAAEELADCVDALKLAMDLGQLTFDKQSNLWSALDNFRNAKDWMLLEGETTSVQCLICLCDCELFEDSCPHCCNEFTGLDEYRDHAPFIDEFNEDLE